jgi:hypothetical protein
MDCPFSVRLAFAALLATTSVADAQGLSSRPASVSLIVIVPPKPPSEDAFRDAVASRVLRRFGNTIEVAGVVGLGHHAPNRIDVRLATDRGAILPSDIKVFVKDALGAFVPLQADTVVGVAESGAVPMTIIPDVVFRLESKDGTALQHIDLPVAYRLIVGSGERATRWTYESVVRIRPDSSTTP